MNEELWLLLFWPFHRSQRFDVERNRCSILRGKLGDVADDLCHWAANRVPIRQIPGCEDVFDVVCRVIADTRLGDVGNVSLTTFRVGTAGKALAGDYSAEEIARAVALRTVSGAIDQIGAAIPLRGFGTHRA